MMLDVDLISMEIIHNNLIYISEEMGIALRNSAFSSNIKERMDHSCAIFDEKGRMLAQAEHIPVHLGSMPQVVKEVLKVFPGDEMFEGDVIIVNDPYSGGTHLPDITFVTPIFYRGEIIGFAVNRAHHSDVGGKTPGSIPVDAESIYEEGLIIPPVKLVNRGKIDENILKIILANTRTPKIRRGDIYAQLAANNVGVKRVIELINKYGIKKFMEALENILKYTEKRMRAKISKLPKGEYKAADYIEDTKEEKLIKIVATVKIIGDKMVFDFSGTGRQVKDPLNAPYPVTLSSSYYVLRATLDPNIPANEGAYRPLKVVAPPGTIVNAQHPHPVVGGNVETSQRIVDVLLKALSQAIPEKIPAASQGTMNNITIGGYYPNRNEQFTFYETIGGGYGARYGLDGESAVHSHMTNTMNTPVEEIERRFPIRIIEYSVRRNSGGNGKWRGGDGIIRKYLFLTEATVCLLGERHLTSPWGLFGGENGKPGRYTLIKKDGKKIVLKSKQVIKVEAGDVLILETPGGGGYGKQRD